jgi:hypothetical protein
MNKLLLLIATTILFSCNTTQNYLQLEIIDDTLYLYDNNVLIQKIPQVNTCKLDSFLIDYYQ